VTETRTSRLLLVTALAVLVGLRCWRLAADLPDFVEEAIPFRRALEMGGWQAGRPDLHPHFFNYPSLVIYLQLALIRLQLLGGLALGQLQAAADFWLRCQADPTGPVLAARAMSVIADLASALGVWRLTRRKGTTPAVLAVLAVAVAGPMVRTGRLIQVDPVQAACTIWALERLLAWHHGGGRGRLAWAVTLIGLAAGAKYQGGLLVLPLAWVLWSRDGARGLQRWPLLAAASLAVFVLTTPFAVLDAPSFWHDLRFELDHMAGGHLGSRQGGGAAFATGALLRGLGPVLALAAVAGLLAPAWQRRRPRTDEVAWWLTVAPMLAAVLMAAVQAERYLVPLIPLLAVAAAPAIAALLAWRPLAGRAWAAVGLAILAIAPPLVATAATLPPAGGHDQVRARRWLEARVAPGEVIVSERYTAQLHGEADAAAVRAHPAWSRASEAARAASAARPRFWNLELPITVSGQVDLTAEDLTGEPVVLEVTPHATRLNASFYATALLRDVAWVQVSGSLRTRHEAQPARYRDQVAWYRFLDTHAETAAVFAEGQGTAVTVYHLDAAAPHLPRTLDPLWWTDVVSADFRRSFERCCVPPERHTGGARYDAEGRVASWIQALRGYFTQHVAPFLIQLGEAHVVGGHLDAARQSLMPVMLLAPHEQRALALTVEACRNQGDLVTADLLLGRSLQALRQLGADPSHALLLQAGLRLDQGHPDEARALARQVADHAPDPALRDRARDLLRALDP
jgi:hypothetical protein